MANKSTIEIATITAPGEAFMHERKVEPCVLVIFGGTGDLAQRKLIPALYNLLKEGSLPKSFAVVGLGRTADGDDAFRAIHREATGKFSRTKPLDEAIWNDLASRIFYVNGDLSEGHTFTRLDQKLKESGEDGLEILRQVKREYPEVEVVMMTAYGRFESAVEATKLGCYQYLGKTFEIDQLVLVVRAALENSTLRREVEVL